ncbi:MAG: methyltransferase domain-containing protein [Verrucomicrobiaceae bacterium]
MSAVDWDSCYRDGETPWEKGMAHPALPLFLSNHPDLFHPKPRIFHPGCGFGHDAALLAPHSSEITALDLARAPIAKARELHPAPNINWQIGDLFSWPEKEAYHFAWEHTCFCAIPTDRRPDYARALHQILKPGGHLAGIFFLNPDHPVEEGPPFGVTRNELNNHFSPYFDLLLDHPDPPTFEGRENRETLMIWCKR